jgi:hypothetical protein
MSKSGFLKESIAEKNIIIIIILQAFYVSVKLCQMAYESKWLAMPREDMPSLYYFNFLSLVQQHFTVY